MGKKLVDIILKFEELFLFIGSLYLFSLLDYSWWLLLFLFLLPDLSMVGYLINDKLGALTYNIVHFRGLSIGLYIISTFYLNSQLMSLIAIVLFSHSTLDRVFGYGLKLDKFKSTHLGKLK